MRIPNHIGIIPDGNRRWALKSGLLKEMGYDHGLNPGLLLLKQCMDIGIKELTFYGFTTDNTKRPTSQKEAFTKSCIEAVNILSSKNAELLVIGNKDSPAFPKELLPYTKRTVFGKGGIKINFLINYSYKWDLNLLKDDSSGNRNIIDNINSSDISRMDLIIRWGGRRRLSGFLPVQSVYSDFYVIDEFWPDFKESHLSDALKWYDYQDITLGG